MKSRMWLLNVCSRIKPEFSDKTKIFESVYGANGDLHVCERFSIRRALPSGDGNGAPISMYRGIYRTALNYSLKLKIPRHFDHRKISLSRYSLSRKMIKRHYSTSLRNKTLGASRNEALFNE